MAAPKRPPSTLRYSLSRITIAGCLAMVYMTAVTSPATTQFFRVLGANEFHFGLLGGIPMAMLFLQFVGALITNKLRRRKPVFVVAVVLARMAYLAIAFLPLLLPASRRGEIMVLLIILIAAINAVTNLITPLWLSWVGDLIPRRRLNSYWGKRHLWMQLTWACSYVVVGAYTYYTEQPITVVFPVLVAIGVVAGVADICLFLRVDEPANPVLADIPILQVLTEPLRHPDFRTFVVYSCAWTASAMVGAAFMRIYVLEVLGLPLWLSIFYWALYGLGSVSVASVWGRLIDQHGSRPVMVLCSWFKPVIALTFMLVTPKVALFVLPPAFVFDSAVNAGMMVARNGYMLTIAPRENRSMFIAAIMGLAGICGGVAAITAGAFLRSISSFEWQFAGRDWNHFQVLFAMSAVLRFSCIPLARRIREPKSSHSMHLLTVMRGVWPFRFFLFPIGFYRRVVPGNGDDATAAENGPSGSP